MMLLFESARKSESIVSVIVEVLELYAMIPLKTMNVAIEDYLDLYQLYCTV